MRSPRPNIDVRFLVVLGPPSRVVLPDQAVVIPHAVAVEVAGQCSFCGVPVEDSKVLLGRAGRTARDCERCLDISAPPPSAHLALLSPEAEVAVVLTALRPPPPPRATRPSFPTAPRVLVIDEEGRNLGEMDTVAACELAKSKGLKLIQLAPDGRPPVCHFVDFAEIIQASVARAREVATRAQCSFCDARHDDVDKLISGPRGVHVCDRCAVEAAALLLVGEP